jgi:hypothetical protein
MAGEIVVQVQLTDRLLGEIMQCGFSIDVMVDCSHNAHVKTMRYDRPNIPIIAKRIELDTTLHAITNRKTLGAEIGRLQAARPHGPLFQFYSSLQQVRRVDGGPEGLSALEQRNLKIEFPNFDASIVNVAMPPPAIVPAIQACSAPTVEAFNQLPEYTRRSMGMYSRRSANDFRLVGSPEPGPRRAVR